MITITMQGTDFTGRAILVSPSKPHHHPNEILFNEGENLRKDSNRSIDYYPAVIQQSSYIKMSKRK